MQILTFLKTPAQNTEQKIFRFVLFAVLPFMAILTVVSFLSISATRTEVAQNDIYTQNGNASKRITLFFEPLFRDIGYLKARGNTEKRLNPNDPDDVRDFLNRFSSFYLKNVREVLFWDGETILVYTLNENGCTGPREKTESLYKNFLNETLQKAEDEKIDWSPAISNSDNDKSAILAAAVFQNPKSGMSYAFALNIDTTEFFAGLEKYMSNRLFLFRDRPGRLPQQFLLTSSGMPDIEETNDPLILAVFTKWKSNKTADVKAYRLMFDKQPWWVSIRPKKINDRQYYSGLIIPESEIIAAMRKGPLSFAWFSSISFAVVLIATIFLWRRYHHDIQQAALPPSLNNMDDTDLLKRITAGEDDRLEFKSTLRWNLHSNKPDKAMEIACLKTIAAFLNSEGGTLLVGVEDDGNILGIGADQFPNEDKFLLHFNNLINQHLGLENADSFSFDVRHLETGDIMIVDCLPSPVPVYVTHDKKEEFYVRIGPGTRPLTTRDALEYIRNHF